MNMLEAKIVELPPVLTGDQSAIQEFSLGWGLGEAIRHLKAVLLEDPAENEFEECIHCGGGFAMVENDAKLPGASLHAAPARARRLIHKPDCPWVAARAFLDSLSG